MSGMIGNFVVREGIPQVLECVYVHTHSKKTIKSCSGQNHGVQVDPKGVPVLLKDWTRTSSNVFGSTVHCWAIKLGL